MAIVFQRRRTSLRPVHVVAATVAVFAITAGAVLVAFEPQPIVVPLTRASGEIVHPALRFAVAGDSFTSYDNHDMPSCGSSCTFSDRTWTYWAMASGLQLAGGYAESGNKSWETRERMPAVDADVLVVELGTNNAIAGSAPETLIADVDAIVEASTAEVVVIAAIPPNSLAPDLAAANNEALRVYSTERGFTYVDPWVDLRDGVNWVPGGSEDGIHPLATDSFPTAGEFIAEAVRTAAHAGDR